MASSQSRPKWDIHADGSPFEEDMSGVGEEFEVDPSVIANLPKGCSFVKAQSFKASRWARIAKITTRLEDGSETHFFMKVSAGDSGRAMLRGEYEGMLAIHDTVPDFAPKPIAWGEFRDEPGTYFFICEFIEMKEGELPPVNEFCRQLAKLHRESVSPTGKFGFDVVTCNGATPQTVDWEDSWEVFFSRGLRHMLELDLKVNGPQPELVTAITPVFDVVIPRLLPPLQQGPRQIRPSLVHGDMWWGNSALNRKTGMPVVFDAAAFYAHNEYDMGNWRPRRSRFGKEYFEAYRKEYPPAHPEQDYEDRILLYSMRFDFQLSILFPGSTNEKKV
ncbi:fructosamine kinase [Xylariaceae sp. FL0594]|nr:fructosamine kinase [Xylariaceae sp. FL0594]